MAIDVKRAVGAMLAGLIVIALAACSGDDAASEGDAPDAGGAAGNEAGEGGGGTAGDDVVGLVTVPATVTAFTTLGQPRSGDGITLSGDGFEHGPRRCTANGLFCVTGGFEP